MSETTYLVAQGLSIAGLLIGTLLYLRLLLRRRIVRRLERDRREAQESGLRGLVRVMLAE